MIRFTIPVLAVLATCATFDVTQPVSNAPDLVSFLRAPRSCFTPCGARVTAGDCETIQRFEGRALERLAPVGGWDAGTICEDLAGYEIAVHTHDPVADRECAPGAWPVREADGCDGGLCCVAGLTNGATKVITVSSTTWDHSTLAHEIVHVADGLRRGHCPWGNPALQLALYELSHRVDHSTSGPECSR